MRTLRRQLVAITVVIAIGLVTGACRRDGEDVPPGVAILDGSPRFPDDEGVVTDVDRRSIELDGGRQFPLSPDLQSFQTTTLAAMSVLHRKGEFVQVGVVDDEVVWVAAIGAVVPIEPPTVFYQGVIERVSRGRLVFEDGTTLQAADGVQAVKGQLVRAEIDPSDGVVRTLVLL